jgi:hypothetical protein
MKWDIAAKKVTPYIFKIETPTGSGTGFLCLYNDRKTLIGIATALHVVEYANTWKQPIRLIHHESREIIFLKESEYIIFADWKTDSAVILIMKPNFELPSQCVELLPIESPLILASTVGWLGFPAIEPYTLCFFSGSISAWQETRRAYLIDGVAINGVSGGPVFYIRNQRNLQIVGIVSEYKANRITGATLPGLLVAQDVSHFHGVINKIQTLDEGHKKKKEMEPPPQETK